jgi:holo-[acyl-carrier protein] synthase
MVILGHGIDIVEIARIEHMLAEHGERFVERCFTEIERAYCESSRGRRAEHYAARFAAKEATFKALGTGWRSGIGWRDVGVTRDPSGQPRLAVSGQCATIAGDLGIQHWHVSLSHAGASAIASVIACGEARGFNTAD